MHFSRATDTTPLLPDATMKHSAWAMGNKLEEERDAKHCEAQGMPAVRRGPIRGPRF